MAFLGVVTSRGGNAGGERIPSRKSSQAIQGGAVRKVVVAVVVLGSLAFAGGAFAGGRWMITSIGQIKPSVRHQLQGSPGARGPAGANGANGANGVVPQIVTVESEQLTLQPGQDSFEVDPVNFQANCPAGYSVLGTGFDGPFNEVGGFVKAYGTFVGGFFENNSLIPLQAQVQAICGQVPGGSIGSARDHLSGDPGAQSPEAQYHAQLAAAAAAAKAR
jgi:hypothetical protein